MKNLFLALGTLLLTVSASAQQMPKSVVNASQKLPNYGSDQGWDISMLCKVLAQNDKGFPKDGSRIACVPLQNGMVAVTAVTPSGKLAVYANLTDRQNDAIFGQDVFESYLNNLGQSFTIAFTWHNTGVYRDAQGRVVQGGHYSVSGTFHSEGKTLQIRAD